MAQTTIDRLIINSPYGEPARHWHWDVALASGEIRDILLRCTSEAQRF